MIELPINKNGQKRVILLCPFSDRGGVRTPNPQSRNLIFYPVELRGQYNFKFQFLNSKFQLYDWNLEFIFYWNFTKLIIS